ncbi:MAG: hypothetical protein KM312_06235 [Hydrogenibacillus schlegelii]|uniref:Uncharacterized protein n=1 Tax=Hydrogenibacillus schlegelii TaxID=1484 RepID=A0A947D1B0_HYDSH|nr:hypothetical protein [Hydrogenibacillus schlegelii]
MNDAFWRRLPPDDRAILLKALEEAGAYELRLIRELEARALKEMAASGLRIHRLTADERTAWEQAVAPLYDEVAVRMPPPAGVRRSAQTPLIAAVPSAPSGRSRLPLNGPKRREPTGKPDRATEIGEKAAGAWLRPLLASGFFGDPASFALLPGPRL